MIKFDITTTNVVQALIFIYILDFIHSCQPEIIPYMHGEKFLEGRISGKKFIQLANCIVHHTCCFIAKAVLSMQARIMVFAAASNYIYSCTN